MLLICSYDYVKIFVGSRLLYRLVGKDGGDEYLKKIDGDDDGEDDDDDDECDDYDNNHTDDGEDDDDDEKRAIQQHYDIPKRRRDSRIVSLHGTGEVVKIVFISDPWVTRRGFFAHYSLGQAGNVNQIN